MSYKIEEEAEAAYKKLSKDRKLKAIILGAEKNPDRIMLLKEIPKEATHEQLLEELPKDDCRYVLYDYYYKTDDGRSTDKIIFILYTPQICKPDVKFRYSFGRNSVENGFSSISTVIQANGVDDLTEEKLTKRLESK